MREPVLPANVPLPLDRELLAWAAGFFDGEGSTIARTDARRPGYYQLELSVPQNGPDGVPEVLSKFQRAMLGVGAIHSMGGTMFKWIAGGGATARLAVALMWPWLGPVKRAQAEKAIERVDAQFVEGPRRPRVPKYRPQLIAHGLTDTVATEEHMARAWAAGFIDAEGCFGNPGGYQRKDGTIALRVRVSATQHGLPGIAPDVLHRMRSIAGGRIERHGEPDDFKWVVEGVLGVGRILEFVRPWLGSVKLDQAAIVLERARSSRVRGNRERCVRGHLYDSVKISPDGTIHQICNACARLRERALRAANGSVPRRVRKPPQDATRTYAISRKPGRGGRI